MEAKQGMAEISKSKMLIGWDKADVTPSGVVSLQGQFHVRLGSEIHDPLTATVLALGSTDGTEQAVIVSLDAVGVSEHVINGCREFAAQRLPGLDPAKFFISATHTHTAPDQPGDDPFSTRPPGLGAEVMSGEEYGDMLVEKIGGAVINAWNNRRPGALSWGHGYAVIGFNRRVSYIDGSTKMYGKTDTPEFSHVEGYEDHGVDMLFTYDSGHELTGMLLNVPCPSQCTEGAYYVSADFWHETREAIRARHGDKLYILPQCGAAGDQSPRTMVGRAAAARMMELKGYGDEYNLARRRDIAEKICAAVTEALPLVSGDIRDEIEFRHVVEKLVLPSRRVSEGDLELARREVKAAQSKLDQMGDIPTSSYEYSSAFRWRNFHQAVISLHGDQQNGRRLSMPVESHCLRIGDAAMCTNPFELYLDYGMRIKAVSKAVQTFVVQLAGAGTGCYLPSERAMRGGDYGAYIASAQVGPDGGKELVARQVETINSFFI